MAQALTPAQRQRRHRAHYQGDHQFCDPARCTSAVDEDWRVRLTGEPDPARTPRPEALIGPDEAAAGLGPAGMALWVDCGEGEEYAPPQRRLLLEACRIVDDLDRCRALLQGERDAWVHVDLGRSGDQVLVVDRLMAEVRALRTSLKTILGELRMSSQAMLSALGAADAPPPEAPAPPPSTKGKGGGRVVPLASRFPGFGTQSAG